MRVRCLHQSTKAPNLGLGLLFFAAIAIRYKMPVMERLRLACLRSVLVCLGIAVLCCALSEPLLADEKNSPGALDALATNFWQWRARYQPFSQDDIPRIEHPSGARDWSADSIAKQKAALEDFEKQWKQIDASGWSVARQVDYRLIGSALARARWELEINPRWQRDPLFYLDQTMTALLEALVQPPPFDAARSQEIVERMQAFPAIVEQGKANLRPLRPFAALAIANLKQIRPELEQVKREVAPMLKSDPADGKAQSASFQSATDHAIVALEGYRTWLQERLDTMPENTAIGREKYEFFLHACRLAAIFAGAVAGGQPSGMGSVCRFRAI